MFIDLDVVLVAFFADPRTVTLLALIGVDLVTGVAAAIKLGHFDLKRVGDFFRTAVIPYIAGYLLVYVVTAILGANMPVVVGAVIQQIADSAGAGAAIVSLLASIAENIVTLRAAPILAPPPTTSESGG